MKTLKYTQEDLNLAVAKREEEIVDMINNMSIETVGNSAKTVDQIIKLITNNNEK